MVKLLLFTVLLNIILYVNSATDKIVCYYGSWSAYRNGNGEFQISHIDPHICTHLIYSFVGLNSDGSIKILDDWLDVELRGFERFVSLREQNNNLKLMIAIGGWNEGSTIFSKVAASENLRTNFANNVVQFLQQYKFDGFDLDWEYPAQRDGDSADKENFIYMIKALRSKFDESGNKYLLTAAVGASQYSMDTSYNVPEMATYLDFINLMEYDFHGSWDGVTGHNAPLNSFDQLNIKSSVHSWLDAGAPAEKLILGLPTYGHSYYLDDLNNSGVGAPAINPGYPGKYTQQDGMLGYNEICELQMENDWTLARSPQEKVPFMFKNHQWVSYDDDLSIKIKVDFAKSLHLGGVMIWSIETDDFLGVCGRKYPLLTTINLNLPGKPVPSTVKPSLPIASTTLAAVSDKTSEEDGDNDGCVKEGYMRDSKDCAVFYYCQFNPFGGFFKSTFKCSSNLVFDLIQNVCNYRTEVQC